MKWGTEASLLSWKGQAPGGHTGRVLVSGKAVDAISMHI
jgi:hypothetical protein